MIPKFVPSFTNGLLLLIFVYKIMINGAEIANSFTLYSFVILGSRLMNDAAFFQPGSGKLTFRSHLSESERAAVKKVASGKNNN